MNQFFNRTKKIVATLLMALVLLTNSIVSTPYPVLDDTQVSTCGIEDPDLGDGYNH